LCHEHGSQKTRLLAGWRSGLQKRGSRSLLTSAAAPRVESGCEMQVVPSVVERCRFQARGESVVPGGGRGSWWLRLGRTSGFLDAPPTSTSTSTLRLQLLPSAINRFWMRSPHCQRGHLRPSRIHIYEKVIISATQPASLVSANAHARCGEPKRVIALLSPDLAHQQTWNAQLWIGKHQLSIIRLFFSFIFAPPSIFDPLQTSHFQFNPANSLSNPPSVLVGPRRTLLYEIMSKEDNGQGGVASGTSSDSTWFWSWVMQSSIARRS
jgi:hypothetical protein